MNTLAQAKRDFELGYLTKWRIDRLTVDNGSWMVWLGEGAAAGCLLTAKKDTRIFKTLDAAIVAIEEIGFRVDSLFQG